MTLGKIIKELVCSIKDPILGPTKLFIVKLLNLNLSGKNRYMVVIDNRLGLGAGDVVLLIIGSGARKLEGNKNMPVDCAIAAKVETVNIDSKYSFLL